MVEARNIAMIGAGMSGLCCAHRLSDAGYSVWLFDKSRGPGGRISTRRDGALRFDHGAQYFTTRSAAFEEAVTTWREAGAVDTWEGRFGTFDGERYSDAASGTTRWVGTPRMSALGRHLAEGLNLELGQRITGLVHTPDGWMLHAASGDERGPFHAVLLSCPGPQAAALLPADCPLQPLASSLSYQACWAVMAHYPAEVALPWDGLKVSNSPLSWVARDSSKPGRAAGERWVLHASAEWSEEHIEASPDWVVDTLIGAFVAIGGAPTEAAKAHRWRYALSELGRHRIAHFEPTWGLGLCGDGLARPRVEDAWRSGHTLAELVKAGLA